jgi:hypothetical protein
MALVDELKAALTVASLDDGSGNLRISLAALGVQDAATSPITDEQLIDAMFGLLAGLSTAQQVHNQTALEGARINSFTFSPSTSLQTDGQGDTFSDRNFTVRFRQYMQPSDLAAVLS